MSGPMTPGGSPSRGSSWQERLDEFCRSTGNSAPQYNIVSDRRGGRTAWSATVAVVSAHQEVQARFWYDGQFINNAKEDAAEVALKRLTSANMSAPAPAGPAGLTASAPASNGLSLRGGAAPSFTASNLLPGLANAAQQPVAWSRSPAAQEGFARPAW